MHRWIKCALLPRILGLLLLCLSGCQGYRFTSLPPGISSIHVPTFVNRTGEPQLELTTTGATIQEFQKDGVLRVVGMADADAALQVTLVSYHLEPLRFEDTSLKTATEYRIRITADISMQSLPTQEILLKKQVIGEASFDTGGDLVSSKRASLPRAARDLAHNIVESIVEYWP